MRSAGHWKQRIYSWGVALTLGAVLTPGALGATRPFTYFESFENALENTGADPRDCNRNGIIDCGADNDCSTVTACPSDCATVVHAGLVCDEWTLPLVPDPDLQLINEARSSSTVNFKTPGASLLPVSRGHAEVVGAGSLEICPADQDNGVVPGGIVPDRMDFHVHTVKTPDINGTDATQPGSMPKAFLGQNSLHWGRHVRLPDKRRNPKYPRFGDTYCVQCMNAFVLDREGGLNLNTRSTNDQPLRLSFWHIAELCDNSCFGGLLPKTADDLAIVEARSAPKGTETFGPWERLVPDINPYDGVQDTFYLTPTYEPPDDINPDPPPGVDAGVTMCWPLAAYVGQGSAKGIDPACGDGDHNGFGDCGNVTGNVARGEAGVGIWALTSFDLARYADRRIQIRFITTTIDGAGVFTSYLEASRAYALPAEISVDDGWYIDNIHVSGLVP